MFLFFSQKSLYRHLWTNMVHLCGYKNLKEQVLLISCISKDITNIQTHLVD